jgi:site-specific DNA-methyltransferase (adenine-specific)
MKNEVFNEDCEIGLKEMADKSIDLAIIDPPFGIGREWEKRNKGVEFIETSYDNAERMGPDFFKELFRVSKEQIIFGYNYYVDILGPTNYLICWDKMSSNNDVIKYSKFELAYTSIRIPANIVQVPWDGYRMGDETGIKKIHPHQKHIKLYQWLISHYSKPGSTILDTHVGSGSSRIAAYKQGCNFIGFENNPVYWLMQEQRFEELKRKDDLNRNMYD